MNGLRVLHRGQDIQKCFARGDTLVVVLPLKFNAGGPSQLARDGRRASLCPPRSP